MVEQGKLYFKNLKVHLKAIQSILTDYDIGDLQESDAQQQLGENITKHQAEVDKFL
jgi:hypothetical protein